jgi:hypothetical protein
VYLDYLRLQKKDRFIIIQTMRTQLLKYIGIGVGVFILLLLIFYIINKQFSPFGVRMSSKTVIKEMRALNRLETASFTIEKVIDAGTTGNRFQELLFGDRILLIAHGEVIAGFDMANLSEESLAVEGQTIRLSLPSPQILVTRLDSDETRVYDRRQGILSKGDKDLESAARLEAEKAIREAACQGGILNEASKNARSQLTALFKTMQFTTVVINIPSGIC